MGAIDEETLGRVVQSQTERVISEFMQWEDGYFKLDRVELSDFGEVEVDAEDFLMREGLSTDQVLSELDSKLEELQRSETREDAGAEAGGEAKARDLASLKSIMGEIRSPEFTGEITQKILSFAQELFGRGVLFVVRQDGFGVMGQFGIESPDGQVEARLRQLQIPSDQPSILRDVAERKEAICGMLDRTEWNLQILDALGGSSDTDSMAAPLVVNGRVLLVLYCDRLVPGPRPGWLAKRIEHYNSLRRER